MYAVGPTQKARKHWSGLLRSLLVSFVMIALIGGAASAQAEKRIFIVANNAGGTGVDRCLASGAKCGAAMAKSFCKAREYKRALGYRKVARQEITGGVPVVEPGCSGRRCEEFVAIECGR
jgi:hypothetical protein